MNPVWHTTVRPYEEQPIPPEREVRQEGFTGEVDSWAQED
jgi:hypothetical protein